jgi:site-specific DNA recombinase
MEALQAISPRRAAVYLRTAVRDETTSCELQRQRRACAEYARQHGLRLISVYADAGVAGTSFHRPALDQLLRDARDGRLGHVVVADLDRLARSRAVEQQVAEQLEKYGVTLSSSRRDQST